VWGYTTFNCNRTLTSISLPRAGEGRSAAVMLVTSSRPHPKVCGEEGESYRPSPGVPKWARPGDRDNFYFSLLDALFFTSVESGVRHRGARQSSLFPRLKQPQSTADAEIFVRLTSSSTLPPPQISPGLNGLANRVLSQPTTSFLITQSS
jgi:hypothetical protein